MLHVSALDPVCTYPADFSSQSCLPFAGDNYVCSVYYVCYVCYIRRRRGCNDNYVCSVLRMLRMLRSSQSCLPFALHSLPPFVHARYGDTETANPKPSTLFPIPEPLSTNGKRQQGMGWLNMAESMQQFSHTIASQVSAFAVWSTPITPPVTVGSGW